MKSLNSDKILAQRPVFLAIGLIISTSLILVAFEWRSFYESDLTVCSLPFIPEVEAPIINIDPLPPPPKPTSLSDLFADHDSLILVKEEFTSDTSAFSPQAITAAGPLAGVQFTDTYEVLEEDSIYTYVESMPVFPGCEGVPDSERQLDCFKEKLNNFMKLHIRRIGISGLVSYTFIIEPDGTISNISIVESVSEKNDEEVIRVVQKLPVMIPGRLNGRPVKVRFKHGVKF